MKNYLEETLKFIESEEMREYLRTRTDWMDRYTCTTIVSFAPAPLEKKIPVLELIAEQTEVNHDHDFYNPAKMVKESRMALDERYNNTSGTMFWLRDWYYHEERCCYGDAFFTEFDAAIRHIKEQNEQNAECLENPENYYSHSINKYAPGENGVLEEVCQWVLNHSGEIWYFDYEYGPGDWDSLLDYDGGSLYLPVPFESGDIILADCRPFSKERRVLILDIGDNADCCSIQCLYMLPNGKVNTGAFKHNSFHTLDEHSHISGLYRAARWSGELPEDDVPLSIISSAIKANPKIGVEILDYCWSNRCYDKEDDNDYPGIIWDQLKNNFGW